jgi:ABC-2 type transport system permease protein
VTHSIATPDSSGCWRRILALVRKESFQILRDPSSYLMGGVLPLLLAIYGYGVSLDLRRIAVGVVVEEASPEADSLASSFRNWRFFTVRLARHRKEVEDDLVSGRLKGVTVLAGDFANRLGRGDTAPVQILVDGSDPNTAGLVANYAQGVWQNWLQQEGIASSSLAARSAAAPLVVAESRVWFNPDDDSRNFFIPGSVALIMTLIGTLLTALVVARERELGTFEQLLVSPLQPLEIIVAKTLPALLIGLGEATMIIAAGVSGFRVPIHGSLLLLYASMVVYLAAVIGVGLFISSSARTQQQAILGAFVFMVPAVTLSGFASPIENMPDWLQAATLANPVRHYLVIVKGLFLKDMPANELLRNLWPLAAIAAVSLRAATWLFRRRIE